MVNISTRSRTAVVSILPFQTFKQLNLKEKDLDKSQQFSIHSATEVKNNAVLGTINLKICIENSDDLRQILTQKFLILRASCTLNLTLFGHDFLTKNDAKLLYKPSGISLLLNNICIKTEGQSENSTFFIKHAHFPHINLHADHKTNNSSFQASPKDFMALFNMNQYEKALHFHQKHIDAFSAQNLAMRDVEELNSTEFQSNLSTKVPKNQEDLKADLTHLLQASENSLSPF
jgi:hypothetical protein